MNKRELDIFDFLNECGFIVIKNISSYSKEGLFNRGRNDFDVFTPNETFHIEVKSNKEYNFIMENYDRFCEPESSHVLLSKHKMRLVHQVLYIERLKKMNKIAFFCKDYEHLKQIMFDLKIKFDSNFKPKLKVSYKRNKLKLSFSERIAFDLQNSINTRGRLE